MTIAELIEAHRAAVLVDEANFTDDGEALDEAAADASYEVEHRAFISLVDAKCVTDDEAQAKLNYFLHGTIGERSSLLTYLDVYSEDGMIGDEHLTRRLLASMWTGGSA